MQHRRLDAGTGAQTTTNGTSIGADSVFHDGTLAVTSAVGSADGLADREEDSQRTPVADPVSAGRRGYRGDPMTPVLELEGVVKKYRRGDEQVHVLVDFDFTLDAGEFVVVTGPSGAGKSTLLHIAGGLDAPDSGTVAVAGQDVWAMAPVRARHSGGATSDSCSSSSTWCQC